MNYTAFLLLSLLSNTWRLGSWSFSWPWGHGDDGDDDDGDDDSNSFYQLLPVCHACGILLNNL